MRLWEQHWMTDTTSFFSMISPAWSIYHRSAGDGGSHDVHAGVSDHCLHGTRRLQASQLWLLLGILVSSLNTPWHYNHTHIHTHTGSKTALSHKDPGWGPQTSQCTEGTSCAFTYKLSSCLTHLFLVAHVSQARRKFFLLDHFCTSQLGHVPPACQALGCSLCQCPCMLCFSISFTNMASVKCL